MLAEVGAAGRIAEELERMHMPIVLVVALLPFVAGMVTGLAVGFVGTSFPIVLGLVAALGPDVSVRPYAALAYGFGHMGQMLSPLHVCHILSNRYFKTNFGPVYRHILPAAAVMGALDIAYFIALQAMMNW